jgi:hypothetical protein
MAEIRKSTRAGRGNLMANLIAAEVLDKASNDTFWSAEGTGTQLFGNNGKDLDDEDEFGEEKPDVDSEDSDINYREDPNEETEVFGVVPEEKKTKKKNVYVDPKRKKTKAELQAEESKSRRIAKKKKKLNTGEPRVVTPVNRILRTSTVTSSQLRKARENENTENVNIVKNNKTSSITFTQKQLLEEAKTTELFNIATLERMKKLEAFKKKPVPIRKKIVGPKIIEVYKRNGNYVTFEGELPSLFRKPQTKLKLVLIHSNPSKESSISVNVYANPEHSNPEETL